MIRPPSLPLPPPLSTFLYICSSQTRPCHSSYATTSCKIIATALGTSTGSWPSSARPCAKCSRPRRATRRSGRAARRRVAVRCRLRHCVGLTARRSVVCERVGGRVFVQVASAVGICWAVSIAPLSLYWFDSDYVDCISRARPRAFLLLYSSSCCVVDCSPWLPENSLIVM